MNAPTIIAIGYFFLTSFFFAGCNVPVKDNIKGSIPSPSADDVRFATKAASQGIMEVELGDIAQRSQNEDVKRFGAMMVTDHTKADTELKKIATDKNIILPDSMSADDQQKVDELLKKTGVDFDRAYIDMMADDHSEDVDLFKKEGDKGKDTDIRSFASTTLPVLEKHLEVARNVQRVIAGM
jgi:putative membrane protein